MKEDSVSAAPRPPAEPTPERRVLRFALRLAVSLGLLFLLSRVIDVDAVGASLRRVRPERFLLLVAVNSAAYLVFAARWRYFGRRLGLGETFAPYWRGVYLFQVASQVVPSPLLGELGRLGAFPPGTSRAAILKSIALDRLANQVALAVAVFLLVPFTWRLELPAWMRWLFVVPMAVVLVAWFLLGAAGGAERARAGGSGWRFLHLLRDERWGVVPLGWGLFLIGVLCLDFYVAAACLGLAGTGATGWISVVPFLTLVLALLPISFGDWGTREAVSLVVLGAVGFSGEEGVAIALVVGLGNLTSALPGVFLVVSGRRPT